MDNPGSSPEFKVGKRAFTEARTGFLFYYAAIKSNYQKIVFYDN